MDKFYLKEENGEYYIELGCFGKHPYLKVWVDKELIKDKEFIEFPIKNATIEKTPYGKTIIKKGYDIVYNLFIKSEPYKESIIYIENEPYKYKVVKYRYYTQEENSKGVIIATFPEEEIIIKCSAGDNSLVNKIKLQKGKIEKIIEE